MAGFADGLGVEALMGILRMGESVAAISDGDWFALCLLAYLVCVFLGFMIVKGS